MTAGVSGATQSTGDHLTDVPVGVHIGAGAAIIVAAALAASAIPPIDSGWRLSVVAFAVGLFATKTKDAVASAAVSVLAWFVVNGFLVDRFGVLSWHGSADLVRAIALTAAAAAGVGLALARRPARSADRSH